MVTSLKRLLTDTIQSFVGSPQLLNASAAAFLSGSCERNFSTWLQDVPPAPATSIYAIPASYSFSATVPSIPKPTSLTPTGTDSASQIFFIFGNKSEKLDRKSVV